MGKFVLTDSPQALPGSCFFCGSHKRDLFIDCGRDVEFHGAIYICVDECLREMVGMTNFIAPNEAIKLQDQVRELEAIVAVANARNEGLEVIINGYQSTFAAGSPGTPDSEPSVSMVPESNDSDTSESESKPAESSGKGKKRTSEPSDDKRVGELRTAASGPKLLPGI